jgi:hypothetical protein
MDMTYKQGLAITILLLVITPVSFASTYVKGNGIIKIKINEPHPNGVRYPLISSLYIGNTLVMPPDNAGADFQITTRSSKGNLWNPTLGRDCRQNPSK